MCNDRNQNERRWAYFLLASSVKECLWDYSILSVRPSAHTHSCGHLQTPLRRRHRRACQQSTRTQGTTIRRGLTHSSRHR